MSAVDRDARLALAIGAVAVAALIPLLAPGLTWLDAGELGAAAWELGVAHPPGFPVYAQLHALVMHIVPLGDVALRGNLASALLGAAGLALLFQVARAWAVHRFAALAATTLVGSCGLFLLHATTIEVYTGAALGMLALLAAGLGAHRGDGRAVLSWALLAGLSLGHHAELRLFALVAGVAALGFLRRRPRALLPMGLAGTTGLAVVLYLPLRAAAGPWRNWGDPSTLSALWDHLAGARIRAAYADQFGVLGAEATLEFAGQLAVFAPVLLALGLVGFVRLARRPAGWLVAAFWFVDAIYSTALNPMGLRDLQNGVPGLFCLGLGAAAALHGLVAGERAPVARRWAAGALAGVGLVAALLAAPAAHEHQRRLPQLVQSTGDVLAPEALLLVSSDNQAAGWAFVQVVEGARPDVAVVVRQHAWDRSSIEPVARRVPNALRGWRPERGLRSLARVRDGWPLGWEWAVGSDAQARPPGLLPAFPVFVNTGAGSVGARSSAFVRRTVALFADGPANRTARRSLAALLSDLAQWHLVGGRAEGASSAFTAALELDPANDRRWVNLGVARSAAGDYEGAVAASREALRLDPDDRTARVNLARYLLQLNRPDSAALEVDALLDADAHDADALGLRGVIRANRGELSAAAADFAAALRRDPDQAEARAGAATLKKLRR